MAPVQNTAQELVYMWLQVPLPLESRHCVSLCQLLNRSSRLHCQLPWLMQQVLKCFWRHSCGALINTDHVCNDDLTFLSITEVQISVCRLV